MMRNRNRGGFALVTVLWALVVIGVLAIEVHTVARADRRIAMNAREAVRARWAARGGLARALESMDRALVAGQLASGETLLGPVQTEEDGVAVHASVVDVSGRLNVNRAARRELSRLLDALGVAPAESRAILGAVSRSPLDRVEELRSLTELTAETYDRVAPHLTVFGDGRVNVNSASTPVLLTLAEMTPHAAAAIVARRRVAPYRNVFEILSTVPNPTQTRMQSKLGELVDRIAFTPRVVEVRVKAGASGGSVGLESVSTVVFSGGSKWAVVRTVEHIGAP